MIISGFTKNTLLDYPGHIACIVFTGGCNFKCAFCHNYNMVSAPENVVCKEDILDFLSYRVGLIDGVVITGGEPCIHSDLPDFIRDVRLLGFDVKLDTNGSKPTMLKYLYDEHLVDYVAMDIKGDDSTYSKYTGAAITLPDIHDSIEMIKSSGVPYEFRITVPKDYFDEATMCNIGGMLDGASKVYLQRFHQSKEVPDKRLAEPLDCELNLYKDILSRHAKEVYIR